MNREHEFDPAPPIENILKRNKLRYILLNAPMAFIVIPILLSLLIMSALFLYISHGQDPISEEIYMAYTAAMLLLLLLSAALNYYFYKRTRKKIFTPLQQLALAAQAIQYGNYSAVVDYHSNDEMGELCSTFRTMQSYLKDAIAATAHATTSREILFSGIAHDLRTPLTAIMGYTEALQLGMGKTPEKRAEYLGAIASCADDLSKLINELSLYNKLSSSRITCHPKPTNFSSAVKSFIHEDRQYLKSKQVSVHFDTDNSVIALLDEREFQRILSNLLANTIKYRDKESSEIFISIRRDGKYAVFSYEDDGPGVPKEKLAHIFEAFYRTDEARSKTSNGSGLGLAIVSEIVTAHHGHYRASSEKGLKLIFDIPLSEGSL